MPAPVPDKDYGFAANCGSAGLRLTPLETIVCRNASLREKDAKMIALVREVEAEVSGVDGDSGRPLNPMAPDQKAWRKATQSRCKNADCLSAAYDTRIATIRSKWRQAF